MENIPDLHLEEVIFASADKKVSAQISKLVRAGKVRKIAPRVYSSNHIDTAGDIVRRNLFRILGHLYPGAVVSHRSAFEYKPTEAGHIFLSYKYTRKINLPGVTVRLLEGPAAINGDTPFMGQIFTSQQARAFLENLQISKTPGPRSKTLPVSVIEEKLERMVRMNGEQALNKLRDEAKHVAKELGMEKQYASLNLLISAILSTHNANVLSSPLAAARAFGYPYDPGRLQLFEELFRALHAEVFENRPDKNFSAQSFRNFAFFESYFSNFIEGTVFTVNEAKTIVETNQPMLTRNEDSHDVLGTFKIVSNRREMSKTPSSPDELLAILQYRHKALLSARTEKNPGLFKDRNNYAGQTAFVDFNLVRGTLIKSFDYYRALKHPFAKAAYMMFVISEVHPFLDGNGRIARIMMNAEMVAGRQSKIMIPTVYRDDYLGALRRLTRNGDTAPYIRMLLRASLFSWHVYSNDMDGMQRLLEASDSFLEHTEGRLKIPKP
ncbi:MAG: cell filamentation protein Fic [Cryomorphaceae bacterium]|nr:MAG: cell filamentation protein Fic [Cryomorphaceae bacterium]